MTNSNNKSKSAKSTKSATIELVSSIGISSRNPNDVNFRHNNGDAIFDVSKSPDGISQIKVKDSVIRKNQTNIRKINQLQKLAQKQAEFSIISKTNSELIANYLRLNPNVSLEIVAKFAKSSLSIDVSPAQLRANSLINDTLKEIKRAKADEIRYEIYRNLPRVTEHMNSNILRLQNMVDMISAKIENEFKVGNFEIPLLINMHKKLNSELSNANDKLFKLGGMEEVDRIDNDRNDLVVDEHMIDSILNNLDLADDTDDIKFNALHQTKNMIEFDDKV